MNETVLLLPNKPTLHITIRSKALKELWFIFLDVYVAAMTTKLTQQASAYKILAHTS